ncbi:MAG: AI-2E family transporter, partial [Chitinophagales bacterium]
FQSIVLYILTAAVLSVLGRPFVNFFLKLKVKNRQMPRSIAALLAMLILGIITAAAVSIFIPIVNSEVEAISKIDVKEVAENFKEPINKIENVLNSYGFLGDEKISLYKYFQNRLNELVNFGNITSIANSFFSVLGNLFIAYFSILFILFFFLRDPEILSGSLRVLLSDEHEEKVRKVYYNVKGLLKRYLLGILLQLSIIAVYLSVMLHFVGLKNAILIGVFAALFNIIPYIGPFIGATVGLLLGLVTSLHLDIVVELLPLGLKIMAVFASAQLIDNFILQPFIFSTSVKAHPLEVFLVVLCAASVGGILAMIVAIPVYTVVRVGAKEFLSEFEFVKSLTRDI